MIVWLTGLSGAGKTTVGTLLYNRMKEAYPETVFLDGDILREVWGDDLGHDLASRLVNAKRLSMLSKMLDEQKVNVVACVLSISPEWRKWNREQFASYYEVKIDPGMEVLKQRDSKGLYTAASKGEIKNVVGVDIQIPDVDTHDLVFDGETALRPPSELADNVFVRIKQRLAHD